MLLLNDGDFSTVGLEFKGAKLNFFDQSVSYHTRMMEKYTVIPTRWRYLSNLAKKNRVDWNEIISREPDDVWWADKVCQRWKALTTFLEGNRQHIFYLTLFYVTTAILFIDKFISELQNCWVLLIYKLLPWPGVVQVWSLSSFNVSGQLLRNDLNQVSSVSLLWLPLFWADPAPLA